MAARTFRKKPVVIEAMHFATETDGEAVIDWIAANGGEVVSSRGHVDGRRYEFGIKTLEGTMLAVPGDWIIRGVQGEFYPCKPDIFEATYEAADA
jgi:hypothetical protein